MVVPRAHRFPIATRVLWRARGQHDWLETVSINASRSGVLFRCDRSPEVGTDVEVIFGFSSDSRARHRVADIICAGRVVRTERTNGHGVTALAATIDVYSQIRRR